MKGMYKEPQSERRHFILGISSFTPRNQKQTRFPMPWLAVLPSTAVFPPAPPLPSAPLTNSGHESACPAPAHIWFGYWTQPAVTAAQTVPHSSTLCAHLLPAQLYSAHPRPGNHQPHNLHSAHLWALCPKLLLTDVWFTQCLVITQKLSIWHALAQYFITYWGRPDGIDMESLLFTLMERK